MNSCKLCCRSCIDRQDPTTQHEYGFSFPVSTLPEKRCPPPSSVRKVSTLVQSRLVRQNTMHCFVCSTKDKGAKTKSVLRETPPRQMTSKVVKDKTCVMTSRIRIKHKKMTSEAVRDKTCVMTSRIHIKHKQMTSEVVRYNTCDDIPYIYVSNT